jgi:hypothetical protein
MRRIDLIWRSQTALLAKEAKLLRTAERMERIGEQYFVPLICTTAINHQSSSAEFFKYGIYHGFFISLINVLFFL